VWLGVLSLNGSVEDWSAGRLEIAAVEISGAWVKC
jgi:hypothetical protein